MKLIPFAFENTPVRVADEGGDTWFVAKDVCAALSKGWDGHSLDSIPDAWKGTVKLTTPGGEQELITISEAAVYKLAFRSNKPEADRLTNWVAADVLPTIRKTGAYFHGELTEDEARHFGMQKALVRDLTQARGDLAEQRKQIAELQSAVMQLFDAAAPRRTGAVGFRLIVDALNRRGIPRKGRRAYYHRALTGIREMTEAMGLRPREGDETGRTMFPVEAIDAWFAKEGNRILAEHLSRQPMTRRGKLGQSVLPFHRSA